MSAEAGVAWLNALPRHDAEHELLSCCGSRAWARAMTIARPFAGQSAVEAAADVAFNALTWNDVEEALHHHPRLGDRPRGLDRESAWSRGEQAGVMKAGRDLAHRMHEADLAYEERFGHVFLICATGLTAGQMLDALENRLGNDVATERGVVRAELLKITHLRLRKLLERP